MRLSGLVSHRRRRTFVGNASGISRGDRNRNVRLARLRAMVPVDKAIVRIDLADAKQVVVVCDHDTKVLARRTFRCRTGTSASRWTGPPTGQCACYLPEPVDETWGRLRHLGARREQLVVEMVAQIQQIRALLECVWPAALDTAASRSDPRGGPPR
jgi:hypothetical protein